MKSQKSQFKKNVLKVFDTLKKEQKSAVLPVIPVYNQRKLLAYLRVISESSYHSDEEIRLLAKWREEHDEWFPSQFKVTFEGTKVWLKEKLLDEKFRILFMIETPYGKPIGHIGLFRFNFVEKTCEIDNVIRGEKDIPGIMTFAIKTLMDWSRNYLAVQKFYLQVFSDNKRAVALYGRCGFIITREVPLKKIKENDRTIWKEDEGSRSNLKRKNVYMSSL